jgi:hypothetical protein
VPGKRLATRSRSEGWTQKSPEKLIEMIVAGIASYNVKKTGHGSLPPPETGREKG